MLDPLTAISLASCVVQFTDFGIKLVTGSIELYKSVDGANAERSSLEFKTSHFRRLANKLIYTLGQSNDNGSMSSDETDLLLHATSCKQIATDLLSVLEDLKVKKKPGLGRKLESFKKAVEAHTPWNKDRITHLERDLGNMERQILNQIQLMMR